MSAWLIEWSPVLIGGVAGGALGAWLRPVSRLAERRHR